MSMPPPATPPPAAGPSSRVVGRQLGRAVVAVLVTALVGGLWSVLLALNLASTPAVPWSVAVMAAILAATWYVLGRWAPDRRRELRANNVPGRVIAWALVAALLAIMALVGVWIIFSQLAGAPPRSLPDLSAYSPLEVTLVLAMAAVVGSFIEEAMFRGYFQGGLERSLGGPAAVAITCLVMAPEHALTQGFIWGPVLFYLVVDAVLGVTAHLTDSILPGLFAHALGLFVFFAIVWPGDAGRPPVAGGGADATFWLHIAQVVAFGALALLAFRHLSRMRRIGGGVLVERD